MTSTAKADVIRCRALLEPAVKKGGAERAILYVGLGNCLDGLGESAKAIETYRAGLAVAPRNSQLSYNPAISLGRKNQLDQERVLLPRDLINGSTHARDQFARGTRLTDPS